MSKPASRIVSAVLALLFALFLADCQDGGSELPNELTGAVITKNSLPAANVKVGLYSVNYIPADSGNNGLVFTTRTDASGKYAFKNVPSGRYNLLGAQDSLGFFRDSISVSGAADAGKDSLGLLGTLTGIVQLQPQDEPRNAVVQVMGSDDYVNVDSAGAFTLAGLAGGFYRLRVSVALPNYVPLFKEVQVHSGRHDTLPAPLVPFFSGIPVVLDIRTSLDTARGIAKITWHPVSYPALLTYLVYRDEENAVNLSIAPINASRITDSVYYDTLYRSSDTGRTWGDTLPHRWEYRVRVEAKNTSIGEPFKPCLLQTVSPAILNTRITVARLGGKPEEIFIGDTVRLVADYFNPTLPNRSLAWIHGTADTLRKADLSGKSGHDTLAWIAPLASSADSFHVVIVDANGRYWTGNIQTKTVASRVIGNILTATYFDNAYAWQGDIVHVNIDSVGKLVIGRFALATKRDSLLNASVKADTLATALSGSKLYLFNAHHADFPGANVLTYDLTTRLWGKETNLSGGAREGSAVALAGKVYALSRGPNPEDTLLFSVLDPATHVWTRKKPPVIPFMTYSYTLSECNGHLYMTGSMNGPYITAILEYDTAADTWSTFPISNRLQQTLGFRLVGVGGTLYALAGLAIGDPFFSNTVDRFDPAKNEWIPAPECLMARGQPGVVAIGSSIYIVSGQSVIGTAPNALFINTPTVEEYRPE